MQYVKLINDIEINFTESKTVNVFLDSNITTIVYDIITDGTSVYIYGFNAKKEIVDKDPTLVVPNSEASSPDFSPTTSNLFNQVAVAPNFIRFETLVDGVVKVRLRGIYG